MQRGTDVGYTLFVFLLCCLSVLCAYNFILFLDFFTAPYIQRVFHRKSFYPSFFHFLGALGTELGNTTQCIYNRIVKATSLTNITMVVYRYNEGSSRTRTNIHVTMVVHFNEGSSFTNATVASCLPRFQRKSTFALLFAPLLLPEASSASS